MNSNAASIETAIRRTVSTPVGELTVEATDRGLRRVSWIGSGTTPEQPGRPQHPVADAAAEQLQEYFAGDRHDFDLPIDLSGLTEVQRAVLTALRETVGWGQTVSYGELAARSGGRVPARAIGSIMGSNPIPIVIGCHRVVAADGIGGYSGGGPGRGRETKLWLLEHEGALPPTLL